MSQQRIAVVGGGIAGLVAARVLQRHRFSCRLVEPRPDLSAGGAGLLLWPSALAALRQLGYPDAETLGVPIHESILRDTKGHKLLRIPLGVRQRWLPRVMTRQSLMQMLERGMECEVVAQACTGVRLQSGKYIVELSDHTAIEADGVVIAGGMNCGLREFISPGSRPQYCGKNSWRGIATLGDSGLRSGVSVETLGPGCRVGLFPLGAGSVYWFVQVNQVRSEPRLAAHDVALSDRFSGWPDPIERVLRATPPSAFIETPISQLLPSPAWSSDRALLVGDAAHGMTPDLARGACTAIVNLLALDRQLARNPSFPDAIKAFQRSRKWKTILVQRASRRAGQVRQLESATLSSLRNLFWRFFPPLFILRTVLAPGIAAGLTAREATK